MGVCEMMDETGAAEEVKPDRGCRSRTCTFPRQGFCVWEKEELEIVDRGKMSATASGDSLNIRAIIWGRLKVAYGFRSTPSMTTTLFTPPV